MNIRIELDLDGLIDAIAEVDAALEEELPIAVDLSADLVASEAKSGGRFKDRSGVLRASIQSAGVEGTWKGGDLSATVSAGAAYASFVEFGTRPHDIKPKHRKALRIPVEGGYRFAKKVRHPGTSGVRYLRDALERVEPTFREIVDEAVSAAMRKAGL